MRKALALLSGAVVLFGAGASLPALANESAEMLIADDHVGEMEPMVVEGTVVDVVGNRVRVRPAGGGDEVFYDINRQQQTETGLEEGSIIRLVLVDEEIVMIEGPGGMLQLAEFEMMEMDEEMVEMEMETEVVEETITIEETVVEETVVEETVVEEPVMVEEVEAEPIRALW